MAFLQLGLPALRKLAGESKHDLPLAPAILAETVTGQADWTQFVHGRLVQEQERLVFRPLKYQSRLLEMAHMQAIARIPEGQEVLAAGSTIMVQVLGEIF
jgi:molybdopterin biosynthesis enzyme